MCIDTTTRAAFDLGYECTVICDACATRDLEFGGKQVSASAVQAALSVRFARIVETDSIVENHRS